MTDFERLQKWVQENYQWLPRAILDNVFQPDFTREQSIDFLTQNKHIPFVFRKGTRYLGFTVIDARDEYGEMAHRLINGDFHIYRTYDNSAPYSIGLPLQAHIDSSLGIFYAKDAGKLVLSTQSLLRDGSLEKVVMHPLEVDQASTQLQFRAIGEGHSGLAMAMSLQAPYVTLRSEPNSGIATKITHLFLKKNDNLIVLTGHGHGGDPRLQGSYTYTTEHIQRNAMDFVSFLRNAGLECGSDIKVILLSCYGADGGWNNSPSFAQILADCFATFQISSTIYAATNPITRFGASSLATDKSITFTEKVGIRAEQLRVFRTQKVGGTFTTSITAPNQTIQVGSYGMRLIQATKPDVTRRSIFSAEGVTMHPSSPGFSR